MTTIRKRTLESKQTQAGPRKRLINNRRVPLEVICPSTNQLSRSVYIVARPVTKAGYFKPLSEGKPPFCHWALLVSEYDHTELRQHIISQTSDPANTSNLSWGTLYEITNGDGAMVLLTNENFGRQFGPDWRYALIAHVGKTYLADSTIYDHGDTLHTKSANPEQPVRSQRRRKIMTSIQITAKILFGICIKFCAPRHRVHGLQERYKKRSRI